MATTYSKFTRMIRWTVAAVAVAVFTVALAPPAQAAQARDEAGVRQLFADFHNAFNNHDAHAVAAFCAEDVDYIALTGEHVSGRATVEQHLQPLFAGRLKAMVRTASVQEVRFLHPDIAILVGSYESRGAISPTGAAIPPTKGIYDWVVVRRAGRWRIALFHEANLPM